MLYINWTIKRRTVENSAAKKTRKQVNMNFSGSFPGGGTAPVISFMCDSERKRNTCWKGTNGNNVVEIRRNKERWSFRQIRIIFRLLKMVKREEWRICRWNMVTISLITVQWNIAFMSNWYWTKIKFVTFWIDSSRLWICESIMIGKLLIKVNWSKRIKK